tara:strand:+ start:12427 stop:13047 length:621 start_codon:yes stop_codon:yes gene_type:complete
VAYKKLKKPFRVGLTGGIACGKSTIAKLFEKHGISIIDTDIIAREVVQKGQPALEDIKQQFGDSVIDNNDYLDRSAMRDLIFADERARHALETILHPRIKVETVRQANEIGGDYQIIVIPLLVKSTLIGFIDRVLVIDCNEDAQIERLKKRDNESNMNAHRILIAQESRNNFLKIADDIIKNDEEPNLLQTKVAKLHQLYSSLASL